MHIELNDARHEVADGTTVADLIAAVTGATRGSAAVVDGAVVPRSAWSSTGLRDGQRVQIITAVQGG